MRIKNWRRFQHYQTRRPPWIRLYRGLLDDPEWHALDDGARSTLVHLWLVASDEEDGSLPDYHKLAFRLRITEKELKRRIGELSHWLEHDASTMLATCYQHATPETEAEAETDCAPRSEKLSRKRKQVGLPERWEPKDLPSSEDLCELPRFRDHARATGRTCADWEAAWRNWLRSPFRRRSGKQTLNEILI